VPRYEFSLGPSTPDHDRALRALDRLDGFASALEANGRFRDALAGLDEGVPISLPTIRDQQAGPEGG
jgi:hypothetical protein